MLYNLFMRIDPLQPVSPLYFADPAALRAADGTYYAFATAGPGGSSNVPKGLRFPVLHSKDFTNWEFAGGALIPPSDPSFGDQFWAPEPALGDDGKYYLYYSIGLRGEMSHQIRVAVSETPAGPYQDTAALTALETHPFAIDAHPFRDGDGTWYLFYARDFLDSDNGFRPGTGLVMDRLIDMTRLAGEERTVMRARHPWQIFQANRKMDAYGGQVFDWFTLEGAFIVPHEGRYYCFYSGSAYGTALYGVDYVVSDSILGPWSDTGGEEGPRILHSIPETLRGPGHNSVIIGPDRNEYIVFHAWDADFKRRQMHIAPLIWTPDGPRAGLEPFTVGAS